MRKCCFWKQPTLLSYIFSVRFAEGFWIGVLVCWYWRYRLKESAADNMEHVDRWWFDLISLVFLQGQVSKNSVLILTIPWPTYHLMRILMLKPKPNLIWNPERTTKYFQGQKKRQVSA